MSKPDDIYKAFSRELLENFTWQLQYTRLIYDAALDAGLQPDDEVRLSYSFDCPSKQAANSLKEYIAEQADDELTVTEVDGEWRLVGESDPVGLDLALILGWVGYMCDAGQGFECRFDGWEPQVMQSEEADEDEAESQAPGRIPAADVEQLRRRAQYPHMVIARLPENIQPMDRGAKYEDPLSDALSAKGLGEVTGGGTQLSASGGIAFVDIELRLANLDSALEEARVILAGLGAPTGSELQFARPCSLPISG